MSSTAVRGGERPTKIFSLGHVIKMIYSLQQDRKVCWCVCTVRVHVCQRKTPPLCRHVQMFPDYYFSVSIPPFLHHPSSFALLSCPTDLLLLIYVIPTFYLLSLSLPQPCLHYVFVCPSLLPFNLFSETSGIFGLVMYNSSVEGTSVFIASKLEWYNPPIDMC